MATGEKLGCFGLTEPDFGSNPGGMRTRARKDGDDYVLNGEKMWITSGSLADVAVIWAKVEEPGISPDDWRIRGFLVRNSRARILRGVTASGPFGHRSRPGSPSRNEILKRTLL